MCVCGWKEGERKARVRILKTVLGGYFVEEFLRLEGRKGATDLRR